MTVRRQKGAELTRESWESLLAFLGPDREAAARKHEEVRTRLIRIFVCRGALDAEELADETINRVAQKCEAVRGSYVGDPTAYFIPFAHRVFLESVRPRPVVPKLPEPDPWELKEAQDQCLELCMSKLTARNRNLILDYYRGAREQKIDRRKELAERMGIAPNALRIRAHRIRRNLSRCLDDCLALNAVE